ncbi:MAG: hypothetical protein M3256_26950 [Actinomycetota bacterium]|nr:hypothetical protein [Actinomycetota bacterium]
MLCPVFGGSEGDEVVLVVVISTAIFVVNLQTTRKAVFEPMFVAPDVSALADLPSKLHVALPFPVAARLSGGKWLTA